MFGEKNSPYKIIWESQAEICKIFNFFLISSCSWVLGFFVFVFVKVCKCISEPTCMTVKPLTQRSIYRQSPFCQTPFLLVFGINKATKKIKLQEKEFCVITRWIHWQTYERFTSMGKSFTGVSHYSHPVRLAPRCSPRFTTLTHSLAFLTPIVLISISKHRK